MTRLLTAAIAAFAIAAFASPEPRRLSHIRRALYISAVHQELFCTGLQRASHHRLASGTLLDRCPDSRP
ncbi:MAG: hypothetical protein AAF289_04455 [Cyanobacteria bacterium P01_A01_bin.135]